MRSTRILQINGEHVNARRVWTAYVSTVQKFVGVLCFLFFLGLFLIYTYAYPPLLYPCNSTTLMTLTTQIDDCPWAFPPLTLTSMKMTVMSLQWILCMHQDLCWGQGPQSTFLSMGHPSWPPSLMSGSMLQSTSHHSMFPCKGSSTNFSPQFSPEAITSLTVFELYYNPHFWKLHQQYNYMSGALAIYRDRECTESHAALLVLDICQGLLPFSHP